MAANLLTDLNVIVGVVAVTVGVVVRAWVSLRKVQLREKSLTDRLERALRGVGPRQRPEIIRALGSLADQASEPAMDPGGLPEHPLRRRVASVRRKPPAAEG